MRAVAALAAVACALALVPAADVRAGGDPGIRELVEGIAPREGLETRTLHVVPLVSVTADAREGAGEIPVSAAWEPAEKGRGLIDLIAGDGAPPAIVPAGTLLLGGEREMLLEWTEPLVSGEPRALPVRVCDVREGTAGAGSGRLGPLAPLDQRKLLLLGEKDETWGLLLRIQQIVVDAPPESRTVTEVLATEWLRKRAAETGTVLQAIPRAYAGRTRGHVAFFGFRPVEVVVARSPADYQEVGPRYMASLAVSHAIWERALGLEDAELEPASPTDYLAPAKRALTAVASARPKRMPRLAAHRAAWQNERGKVAGTQLGDPFVVRLVAGDGDAPMLLEAIEDGERTIHPLPLRKVGGRPVDEGPDIKGGALTEDYLKRLMERQAQRNQR